MKISTTYISFPDINLSTRDAHKLRGYFGNLFREKSPLLHNHFESGRNRYAYPLVQYKVLNKVPYLIGLNEGAELLIELFLKIKEIKIEERFFPIYSKNIVNELSEVGIDTSLNEYKFQTLWMALNQSNFNKYINLLPGKEKKDFLEKILIGNILSFYKYMNYTANERIYVKLNFNEKETLFKNRQMIAFSGKFTSNVLLPDYIGLGKAVSRGFGTIKKRLTLNPSLKREGL